jgi:halimadienyl-diphosphate synthase
MFIEKQPASWTRDVWQYQARQLLCEIGSGLISASAYDTAWVARLIEQDANLGEAALEWLCAHQLSDGSWGTEEPICYHDRVICTLSAMTALARYGRRTHDHRLISNGQAALEELTHNATHRLVANPAGATVGFEMLAPALVAEAEEVGILRNQGNRILWRLEQQRRLKLAKLEGRRIDRTITAAFSAEMVGQDLSRLDIDNLPEANGSIAYSPSATAFFLLKVRPGDQAALAYLHQVEIGGAVPYVGPTDIFECAWSLWNLALTDWSESLKDSCQRHLDTLERAWQPGAGVAAATGLSLVDGDDTAMAFKAMLHWGRHLDTDALLFYESEKHFLCFRLEADPSTSTNIHLLSAFRAAGFERSHPAVQKILNFLLRHRMADGMWVDKWHLSPYYPTAHAIIACAGYDDETIEGAVKQILAAQNPDGSWGYLQQTAEETAYALQALCIWKRNGHTVDEKVLRTGARWLTRHSNAPYPLLWIGKCLYCPVCVVRAAILGALGMVLQELRGEL